MIVVGKMRDAARMLCLRICNSVFAIGPHHSAGKFYVCINCSRVSDIKGGKLSLLSITFTYSSQSGRAGRSSRKMTRPTGPGRSKDFLGPNCFGRSSPHSFFRSSTEPRSKITTELSGGLARRPTGPARANPGLIQHQTAHSSTNHSNRH